MIQPDSESFEGERWDVFCALPDRPNAILDVGCGSGLGFETFRSRGSRVVGVDIDMASIDKAAGRLDEALVVDVEQQPWPEHFHSAFDVVVFCDCLEHLIDPWKVLRAARSLLTRDGVVVASIPNLRQVRVVTKLVLGRFDYVQGAGTVQRAHLRFFTRKTVTDMFTEAGYDAPRFYFPRSTFHLRRPERVMNACTLGHIPDLFYGSYTVSAKPSHSQAAR